MNISRRWKSAYCILPLIFVLIQYLVFYLGAKFVCMPYGPFDFATGLDQKVPFVPEFIYIYVGSYVFWIICFFIAATGDKENFYILVASVTLTYFICFLFYVFLPTTIIRPEVGSESFTMRLVDFIYKADTPALNLFPSMHCLASWLCFIAVRKMKNISPWVKTVVCIFALAVFASTQLVKQHYLADVFSGVALAELGVLFIMKTKLQNNFMNVFNKINKILLKIEY